MAALFSAVRYKEQHTCEPQLFAPNEKNGESVKRTKRLGRFIARVIGPNPCSR